jgi:hypothetical protein
MRGAVQGTRGARIQQQSLLKGSVGLGESPGGALADTHIEMDRGNPRQDHRRASESVTRACHSSGGIGIGRILEKQSGLRRQLREPSATLSFRVVYSPFGPSALTAGQKIFNGYCVRRVHCTPRLRKR